MSITIQGLHDAIVAIIAVAGIAVIVSLALTLAGSFWQRSRKQTAGAVHPVTVPVQHPTEADQARELVLR
jgi:hypothetical protein